MRVRFPVLLGVLLSLSASLAAQQLRESVTIEVVDVPVYVTRGGGPVEGLTRDDFELYVNGKRQPIEYFDASAHAAPAGRLDERRLFLLLFDVTYTHPHSLLRAQEAAAHLVANASPGDYFAVATYSMRRGVWLAVPFTRDRPALTRALASLRHSGSGDPLSIVMTSSERETFGQWAERGGMIVADSGNNLAGRIAAESLLEIARDRLFRAAEHQVLDLTELAERLTPLDGEKHVVILSEGFDGRSPSPADVQKATQPRRWNEGGLPVNEAFSGYEWDPRLTSRIVNMHRVFHRANVLLHGVDLEGVANARMANDALAWLTMGTGGHFVYGRNDLRGALAELSGKLAHGYRLGFRPADVRPGYNSIEVKLRNRRGLRVHHRLGFYGTPPDVDVNDGLYLADVLLNDVRQSGTAATLELQGRTLRVSIPMREVAAQLPNGGHAELLLYAFDANGTALMYHRQVLAVTDTESATIEVKVPEGTRVAKALLRVDGMLGFSKAGG